MDVTYEPEVQVVARLSLVANVKSDLPSEPPSCITKPSEDDGPKYTPDDDCISGNVTGAVVLAVNVPTPAETLIDKLDIFNKLILPTNCPDTTELPELSNPTTLSIVVVCVVALFRYERVPVPAETLI
jgi:hypothetical protein